MRQPVPFGKYLLLDRISVGGMAEVFKAKSYGVEGFEKIIAIKRILPTMGEDRDFIKMFIDEAKIAGQLAHANICQIFELGRIDGSHFIAMEYIWGKDLLQIQNRLRKNKQPMPIPMACFSIAKVLEGLDYAHRKRDPLGRPLEIVHRDCSPQNVLVSYEGEVKVIDFGIAKATSRNSRTMAGVLKGKFGYMSPEQVRGLPLDRRSDIFAIGTMLYECLTGERLFQGETDFSTLEKVRNVDIQAPRTINPLIPEAVEKVILKALAKDVDDRYQWCSEMLADLQAFLMSQDVVFTAKSLSQWLKEVFQTEIERERQLLEQYKRVGRDGLIAGAPAAESKLDVVAELGEAGKAEGDATVLGGPNFDDMEQGVGATPEFNQSPQGRGNLSVPPANKKTPAAAMKPASPAYEEDEEGEGDFGEEAPTEIFGDDQAAAPTPMPVTRSNIPGRKPSTPPIAMPRTNTQQRPGDQPGMAAGAAMPAIGRSPTGSAMPAIGRAPSGDMHPGVAPGYQPPAATPYPNAQPYGTPPGQQPAVALGSHGGHGGIAAGGLQSQQPEGGEGPQRTVLGVQAPPGLPNYANFRPSQPQQASSNPNMQSYPGYQQPVPTPQGGYGYQQPGYPPGQGPYAGMPQAMYGSGQMNSMTPSTPYDQMGGATPMPIEGRKSTLVRDIAIGVGIAALVLVGFLIVKMFVLDKDSTASSGSAAPTSTLANVKIKMPPGVTAEMEVDGARVATVENGREIAVSPGMKHIKLTGKDGLSCDDPRVKLEAGRTALLVCGFGQDTGSGATTNGSAAPPQTGSAVAPTTNTGSATTATGATGAGSAATQVAQGGTTDVKTDSAAKTETKTETKATTHDVTVAKSATGTAATKTETKTEIKTDTKPETKPETKTDTKTSTKSDVKTSAKTGTSSTATKTEAKTGTGTTGIDTKTTSKDDANKGYLQVFSKPNAKILVDGADTNMKTPISGHSLSLAPGKHKITFVINDDRFTYPVIIKAGQTEQMSKDLQ